LKDWEEGCIFHHIVLTAGERGREMPDVFADKRRLLRRKGGQKELGRRLPYLDYISGGEEGQDPSQEGGGREGLFPSKEEKKR